MKDKIDELSAYHSYEFSQKDRYGHKSKDISEFNSYGFDIDLNPKDLSKDASRNRN